MMGHSAGVDDLNTVQEADIQEGKAQEVCLRHCLSATCHSMTLQPVPMLY